MGEKPLYWGWCDDVLLFGSELKVLKVHPAFNAEIDRNALTLLLRHCCIPAPYSIYKGIQKLLPGHWVSVSLGGPVAIAKSAEPVAYWRMNDAVEQGLANPFSGSAEAAVDALETQLTASIGEQMLADVPLGAFLSGGVDSSTVVALMQPLTPKLWRTTWALTTRSYMCARKMLWQ
jgi:asparagine synthase (glutamine-hydrolysing)